MRIKSKYLFSAFAAASVLAVPATALATNGYFLPGYGAKSIGMGGAGVAYPQDALASASNPAGLLEVGTRADMGLGLFNPPRRGYTDTTGSYFGDGRGTTEARSANDWFPVPNMGFTFQFDEKLAIGFAVYGNGLGTAYKPNFYNFTGVYGDAIGVDLMQVLMPITAAYRVTDTQSVGVSFVTGYQRFRAKGLGQFAAVSSNPERLTDKGYDFATGAGARVGWLGKFAGGRLNLGASYASRVYMTRFDEYRGLFAEQGGFDVPANFSVGFAVKAAKDLDVVFDYEKIFYSKVKSVGNLGPYDGTSGVGYLLGLATNNGPGALGRDDGMGFGWTDQEIYKLGLNYKYSDKWTFRAGLNYGKSPIPASQLQFNVIAPATVEKHAAIGFTYNLGEQSILGFGSEAELTVSFLHAFRHKQHGPSALGICPTSGALPDGTTCTPNAQNVGYTEFEMKQNELEISYGLKF